MSKMLSCLHCYTNGHLNQICLGADPIPGHRYSPWCRQRLNHPLAFQYAPLTFEDAPTLRALLVVLKSSNTSWYWPVVSMENSSIRSEPDNARGKAIKPEQRRTPQKTSYSTVLRYRRKSLWIPAVYLILLIVPWIIDCVLTYKPYNYLQRYGLSEKSMLNSEGWLLASLFIAKIQTLVAIPVVSTLLAHAAVVYSQRRTSTKKLSVRQLLVLADRAWGGIPGFWNARHRGVGSRLVTLGGLLILLVSVQPPVQSLFAGIESVNIVTCYDTPIWSCDPSGIEQVVGFDPGMCVNPQGLPCLLLIHDSFVRAF